MIIGRGMVTGTEAEFTAVPADRLSSESFKLICESYRDSDRIIRVMPASACSKSSQVTAGLQSWWSGPRLLRGYRHGEPEATVTAAPVGQPESASALRLARLTTSNPSNARRIDSDAAAQRLPVRQHHPTLMMRAAGPA